jgi:DNA-directed RNA polymerase specialized sigma24 family protein
MLLNERFPRTSRSLIDRARLPGGDKDRGILCEAYWGPVYAFIRRRVGSKADAQDRTQSIFVRLLDNGLATFDLTRGTKFRSWLLACVRHHLWSKHDNNPPRLTSLDAHDLEDRCQVEPSHDLTPERLYERKDALSLLTRVMEQVRAQYVAAGNAPRFEALKGRLSQSTACRPYGEVAAALNMTEGAVKKAASDLRDCYTQRLRAEAARRVTRPDDKSEVDAELRRLLAALQD